MSRRSRRLACAAVVLVLLAACGLPEDGGPQAIAPDNIPPALLDPNPSSSTTLSETGPTVIVYFLQDTPNGIRLAEVERRVGDASHPRERLVALFNDLTERERDAGLTTQIPADTGLLDVVAVPEADEVIVDVSGDLLTSIQGPFLSQAFAQIVWTATEPGAGGYTSVRFLIDGEPSTVIDGEGVQQDGPVARSDYSNLSPPS